MIEEEVAPTRYQQPPENTRKAKPKPNYTKYVA
jgi:hypothetical protein